VGRFERIQDDWEYVCSVLGREPKLGNQARSSHDDYRTYYDNELVEIAATKYKEDIELLGYTFE
jgi:hypothetical protein